MVEKLTPQQQEQLERAKVMLEVGAQQVDAAWRPVQQKRMAEEGESESPFSRDPETCQCEACEGGVSHASSCAVHRAPAEPAGPCSCGALLPADSPVHVVLHALELCERDFAFLGGCTMTDRPDLPLSSLTSWKMDFSQCFGAIDAARAAICELTAPLNSGRAEIRSASAEQPEGCERHPGCLFSGRNGPFAPISALSNEGRCIRCTSTLSGKDQCP